MTKYIAAILATVLVACGSLDNQDEGTAPVQVVTQALQGAAPTGCSGPFLGWLKIRGYAGDNFTGGCWEFTCSGSFGAGGLNRSWWNNLGTYGANDTFRSMAVGPGVSQAVFFEHTNQSGFSFGLGANQTVQGMNPPWISSMWCY